MTFLTNPPGLLATEICRDPQCSIAIEHPADHRGPYKTGLAHLAPTVGHVTPDPNPRTIDHAKRAMEFLTSKIPHRAPDEDDDKCSCKHPHEVCSRCADTDGDKDKEDDDAALLDAATNEPEGSPPVGDSALRTVRAPQQKGRVISEAARNALLGAVTASKIEGEKAQLVMALETAAINLRDSELLKAQRVREYQEALNAFNKFVAPVEAPK